MLGPAGGDCRLVSMRPWRTARRLLTQPELEGNKASAGCQLTTQVQLHRPGLASTAVVQDRSRARASSADGGKSAPNPAKACSREGWIWALNLLYFHFFHLSLHRAHCLVSMGLLVRFEGAGLDQIPDLLLASCVCLAKLLHFSETQFSHP